MAGVSVDSGGKGGRRSVDSDINMIPMIDLLMVTISFLLITAVWTHMSRINADAQVPGPPDPEKEVTQTEPDKQLHVEMRGDDKFTLIWKQGAQAIDTIEVERKEQVTRQGAAKVVRYPELAEKIKQQWGSVGQHRAPTDRKLDQAILHTDAETPYMNIIGVIDAIYQTHRPFQDAQGKVENVPAFNVTFSVN